MFFHIKELQYPVMPDRRDQVNGKRYADVVDFDVTFTPGQK